MNCVLTEARLVTMQPGVQGYQITEPQTLIIEQGRIQHIGQHIDLPSDAHPISCLKQISHTGID